MKKEEPGKNQTEEGVWAHIYIGDGEDGGHATVLRVHVLRCAVPYRNRITNEGN